MKYILSIITLIFAIGCSHHSDKEAKISPSKGDKRYFVCESYSEGKLIDAKKIVLDGQHVDIKKTFKRMKMHALLHSKDYRLVVLSIKNSETNSESFGSARDNLSLSLTNLKQERVSVTCYVLNKSDMSNSPIHQEISRVANINLSLNKECGFEVIKPFKPRKLER